MELDIQKPKRDLEFLMKRLGSYLQSLNMNDPSTLERLQTRLKYGGDSTRYRQERDELLMRIQMDYHPQLRGEIDRKTELDSDGAQLVDLLEVAGCNQDEQEEVLMMLERVYEGQDTRLEGKESVKKKPRTVSAPAPPDTADMALTQTMSLGTRLREERVKVWEDLREGAAYISTALDLDSDKVYAVLQSAEKGDWGGILLKGHRKKSQLRPQGTRLGDYALVISAFLSAIDEGADFRRVTESSLHTTNERFRLADVAVLPYKEVGAPTREELETLEGIIEDLRVLEEHDMRQLKALRDMAHEAAEPYK